MWLAPDVQMTAEGVGWPAFSGNRDGHVAPTLVPCLALAPGAPASCLHEQGGRLSGS